MIFPVDVNFYAYHKPEDAYEILNSRQSGNPEISERIIIGESLENRDLVVYRLADEDPDLLPPERRAADLNAA
jgi:hypothetical protein